MNDVVGQGYHIFCGVVMGGLTKNQWPRSFNFFVDVANGDSAYYLNWGANDTDEGFEATTVFF